MDMRIPLAGGRGELRLRGEGERLEVLARLPDDRRGLYKCRLTGPAGQERDLGAFLPEQGELRLRRTLSRRALEEGGMWPIRGGRAELAFPFSERAPAGTAPPPGWVWENDPAARMGEALLRRCAREVGRCLRRTGAETVLAVPFSVKKPLPLLPAFCLMRVVCLAGRLWAVLRLNREGWPAPPPEEGELLRPSPPSGADSPPGRPPEPAPAPPACPGRRDNPGSPGSGGRGARTGSYAGRGGG